MTAPLPDNGVYRNIEDHCLYHFRMVLRQTTTLNGTITFREYEIKRYKSDENWKAVMSDNFEQIYKKVCDYK